MDTSKLHDAIQSLTLADVLKSYSGKPGCACGCRGDYRTTEEALSEANKDRGYDYEPGDVQPRSVLRVLRMVQAWAAEKGARLADNNGWGEGPAEVDDSFQYVHAQVSEKRVYTVYLTAAARARLNALTA